MTSSQPDIQVFNETSRPLPLETADLQKVAQRVSEYDDCQFRFIELVYVDETEIARINKKHLDRDYVTDIITFRYDDPGWDQEIEGTLFCCAPRIEEQAKELNEPVKREYLRIFIHGLLHLKGYDDKTDSQKNEMTERENFYLDLISD